VLAVAGLTATVPHFATALPALPFDGKNPCADQGGAVCGIVRHLTNDPDLAGTLRDVFTKGFDILLIIVIAMIIRALLNRMINRVVRRTQTAPSLHELPGRLRRGSAGAGDDIAVTPDRRGQRAETIGSVLRSAVTFTISTIALIEVLGKLGIALAPIVASAGIVGVAIGFGAQNLVKDFLSGIFMILEDQYGVGDVIDVGDATGTVEAVALRTTRLRDVKGTVWHVRNGEIVRIGNKSQGWARALLDIPVAWDSDVEQVRDVVKAAADSLWQDEEWSDKVVEEPEVWGLEDMGAAGLVVRLAVKTAPLQQWKVARELRERVKAALDSAGILVGVPLSSVRPHPDAPAEQAPAKETASRRTTKA
jgi:small conductance mechanosensitive channel